MSRVSFGDVWDRTRAFAGRESALLAPVALACFALPMIVWAMVAPEAMDPMKPPPPGAWMIWPIPLLILQLVGLLTLSALALTPGISVREAFRQATWRLPVALGILLVALGIGLLLAIAIGVVTGALMIAGLSKESVSGLTLTLFLVVLLVASARLMVLWPIVAAGREGPIGALRRAFQLSSGDFWRLFGLLLLALTVSMVLTAAVEMAGGSMMLILGRMIGNEALGRMLGEALSAIILSLWQMVTVVYVAFLYRAYAGDDKATWDKRF